ncbi:hypothetical protein ACHAXM_002730 [Skeletonema potamos]
MYKYKHEQEIQGDQANRRQGRARRNHTKSISDISGMFVDLTTTDVAQRATKKMSTAGACPSLVESEEEDSVQTQV